MNYMKYVCKNMEDIGISLIIECFRKSISLYNVPVISVGPGSGALEKLLEKELGIDIICVDPDPLSYTSLDEPFIKPLFSTVEEIIRKEPKYVGNCILFICNAEPCLYDIYILSGNNIPYDYNAVQLLRPKCIISIYDPIDNIAGSEQFSRWIEDNKNKILLYKDISTILSDSYVGHDRLVLLNNI